MMCDNTSYGNSVTDIKEEVANRAEEDKNFLLLRVFMIFSLENNKLWI